MPWKYKKGVKGTGWYFGSRYYGKISKKKRNKISKAYYAKRKKRKIVK